MINYILIHAYRQPEDGAFIRVRNLNSAISELIGMEGIEIVLISSRFFRQIFHARDDNHIFRRRLILPILWTNNHLRALIWNRIMSLLTAFVLSCCIRPKIIVEEELAAWELAHSIKKWRRRAILITDLHGVTPEEIAYTRPASKAREAAIRSATSALSHIVGQSDAIICQSPAMIDHLQQKYGRSKGPMHPFPCSMRPDLFRYSQQDRDEIRALFGIRDDDSLFVYCGSLAKWQKVDYAIKVFGQLLNLYSAKAKFLILTAEDTNELMELAAQQGLDEKQFIVRQVPHDKVPAYLSACDIGFLIREDITVNRVASPTKLGEYLACGLPVIVGDVAKSWVVARSDPSCFCFIETENAEAAARNIRDFLSAWKSSPRAKSNAMNLARTMLSNTVEIERLLRFLQVSVLDRLS